MRLIALLHLALLASGCAAGHRTAMPRVITAEAARDRSLIELRLEHFAINNRGRDDPAGAVDEARRTFARYLAAEAKWASVVIEAKDLAAGPVEGHVPVGVRVTATVDQTYDPTFVLEALAPLTYLLVTPAIGDAVVRIDARLKLPTETQAGEEFYVSVTAPYSQFDYGWFDTREVDQAFRRAWDVAMRRISREIVERIDHAPLGPLLSAADRARAERRRIPARPASLMANEDGPFAVAWTSSVASASVAVGASVIGGATSAPVVGGASALAGSGAGSELRGDALLSSPRALAALGPELRASLELAQSVAIEPRDLILDNEGFDIIRYPVARGDDGFLSRYLGALGGIELARYQGSANIESRTKTESSVSELVGSGGAKATGYRIAAFRPPDRTGFFFPPALGLLWEDITIASFREDTRLVTRAGRTDIPAVASDPATGQALDINEPISYALRMRSAYLGQGVGLNLVFGNEDVQLFFTAAVTANILELRYIDVQIWKSHVEGLQVEAFKSGSFRGQVGIAIQPWHLALRLSGSAERYFEFAFPQPVEFPAASRYVPEKDIFERERAFATSASLDKYDFEFSAVFLF